MQSKKTTKLEFKDTLVTVIIPSYNAKDFIEETIQSVINQSYPNWELLVVDDGSTDDSSSIILDLEANDDRILYIYKENGGVSSARNLGFKKSKGEYVAFLDSDDVWLPDFLMSCLEAFTQCKDCGIAYSDLEEIDSSSKRTGIIKVGRSGMLRDSLLEWKEHIISPPSGVLIKRSVIESIGGFDEKLSNNADQDFYIRACSEYEVTKTAKQLLQYRVREDAMHTNISVLEKDSLRVFRKAARDERFYSSQFERKCFSNMYLLLSVNYWMHESNLKKTFKYMILALIKYPPIFISVVKKFVKKV